MGDRVLLWRRHLGWTQHQLADASGISRRGIQRIEAGAIELRADDIEGLCMILHRTPNELFGWSK